jgi:hypothetical protein
VKGDTTGPNLDAMPQLTEILLTTKVGLVLKKIKAEYKFEKRPLGEKNNFG